MKNQPSNEISIKIKEFIKDIGLPLNLAPMALEMGPQQFMDWWAGVSLQKMRTNQVVSLANFLHINEDEIMNGTYQKDFVRQRVFSGPEVLPEKYKVNAFSFMRSSAHVVKYMTMTRGQHFSDQVLRKLNISPTIYQSFDNKINLRYFVDLLEVLQGTGFNQIEMDSLACMLFLSLETTTLGQKFAKARDHYECYEVLALNSHLFDDNFKYHYDLDKISCRISAELEYDKLYPAIQSGVHLERLLRYRKFLFGWFPYLSGLRPIMPEAKHVYYSGGVKTLYEIKFHRKITTMPACPLNL